MAIGRITYANKVDYRQEGQDDKYKITAENMNEIKRVFNNSAESIEKGLNTIDENVKKTNDARDLAKQYMEQASQDALAINGTANGIIEKVTTEDGYAQINDSSNRRLNNMIIRGNSEQIKTTGKNLLLIYKQTQTVNGITLTYDNDNKVIIANGTATSWTNIALGVFDFKKGITYKFVGCPKGGSVDTLYHIEPNGGLFFDIGNGATYTPSEDKLNTLIYFVVTKGVVLNNLVIKPMITTDLNVTYDDYEPYTGGKPSPSPEYPQEIKAVNKLSGVMCGKNLFNYNTYKKNDKQLKIIIRGGKTLFRNNSISSTLNYKIYDINGNSLGTFYSLEFTATNPLKLPTNASYIEIKSDNPFSNLYIGYSSNTTYEPYIGSILNYTLQNPLYKLGDVYDYIDFNRGKIVRNIGVITFDGSDDEDIRLSPPDGSRRVYLYLFRNSILSIENINPYCKSNMFKFTNLWTDGVMSHNHLFYVSSTNIYVSYNEITSLNDFKTWLNKNPITVVYQLATPTEEDIPAELLSQLKELQTYVTTTNVMFEASDVYPIVDLEYIADTKTYIDNKFKELAEVIITSTSEEEL
jgi:hypothetical protein|nr:MAG TPA: hypothetical protein [Caudoviricetes sp.]